MVFHTSVIVFKIKRFGHLKPLNGTNDFGTDLKVGITTSILVVLLRIMSSSLMLIRGFFIHSNDLMVSISELKLFPLLLNEKTYLRFTVMFEN